MKEWNICPNIIAHQMFNQSLDSLLKKQHNLTHTSHLHVCKSHVRVSYSIAIVPCTCHHCCSDTFLGHAESKERCLHRRDLSFRSFLVHQKHIDPSTSGKSSVRNCVFILWADHKQIQITCEKREQHRVISNLRDLKEPVSRSLLEKEKHWN